MLPRGFHHGKGSLTRSVGSAVERRSALIGTVDRAACGRSGCLRSEIGDHDRFGHHHGLFGAHMQIGGVQIHVGETGVIEPAGAERTDGLIQPGTILDTSAIRATVRCCTTRPSNAHRSARRDNLARGSAALVVSWRHT